MNFAVIAAMIFGEVTLDHFNSDLLASNEFQLLMPRVEMRLQDKEGEDAVDIEVICEDGSRICERGTYEPVTWLDIERKFSSCIKYMAQPIDASSVLSKLHRLDVQQSITGIFE